MKNVAIIALVLLFLGVIILMSDGGEDKKKTNPDTTKVTPPLGEKQTKGANINDIHSLIKIHKFQEAKKIFEANSELRDKNKDQYNRLCQICSINK